jgi:hypothetical protein
MTLCMGRRDWCRAGTVQLLMRPGSGALPRRRWCCRIAHYRRLVQVRQRVVPSPRHFRRNRHAHVPVHHTHALHHVGRLRCAIRSDEGKIQDLCAAALFNMMFDSKGRERLMKEGVLWASVRLASSSVRRQGGERPDSASGIKTDDTSRPATGVPPSSASPPFLRLRTSRSMSSKSLLEVMALHLSLHLHLHLSPLSSQRRPPQSLRCFLAAVAPLLSLTGIWQWPC